MSIFHRSILVFAAGCLLLTTTSCDRLAVPSDSDGPQQWRFALEEPVGSVQHAYALKFKELIEKKTDGRITVQIYPYGTLGTSDQITEQLPMEAVQFAMASPGHVGKIIPEVQVFLLHFLLSDNAEVNRQVLQDPRIIDAIDELYAEKGMQLLSIYAEGWQVWTTQKPIRRPSDFSGVKMRIMTSPLLMAAYDAYGANPTPLPYSEVYSALQLKMVDAQVNPIFAVEEMSFYEVTDWMIFPNHAQFVTTAVASRPFFQELPAEEKKLVRETIAELNDYIFEVQREFNSERMELILHQRPDLSLLTLNDEQRERFRQASLPVRNQFDQMAGPRGAALRELLQSIVDEKIALERSTALNWSE